MVKVSVEQPVVTLISVHRCAPGDQDRLAALLSDAATRVFSKLPGFVSATVHKSFDGGAVTNYAQYRTRADFDAVRSAPAVAEVVAAVQPLLTGFEAHLYEVVAQRHAEPGAAADGGGGSVSATSSPQ